MFEGVDEDGTFMDIAVVKSAISKVGAPIPKLGTLSLMATFAGKSSAAEIGSFL